MPRRRSDPNAPANPLLRRLRRALLDQRIVLALAAIAVGTLAGGGAILFRHAILLVQHAAFGWGEERLASAAAALPAWRVVLAPALGGLVVGLLVRRFLPEGRPQGVADVIEAVTLRQGRIGMRAGAVSAIASALSLGSGASLGREGPVVHLGAALASRLSAPLRLPARHARTLVGCGVASAVAASFNAPLAGALFALEVVTGGAVLAAFTPIVLGAVVGTIMTRAAFGEFPAFLLPPQSEPALLEYPLFALLGLAAGAVALAFMGGSLAAQRAFQWTERRLGLPRWLHPGLGGLLLGLLALGFPQVLGVGYQTMDEALRLAFPLPVLAALLMAKLAASWLSYGSGFAGGFFGPALYLGALAGAAFGLLAGGGPTASLYAVVGMGAVAAAVLGAPISTVLMVFEMTASHTVTLAALIGVTAAVTLTRATVGHSLFTWQLARRGVRIPEAPEASTAEKAPGETPAFQKETS
ncbi:chloride channel protein [Azospirillum sp. SYSU D00513]|uniref:chloride channel protein n=1 Tax=Azospirillum sp. SYSU D00513 TaxID=2812561 RepID=UPI001A97A43C|nr:chloride channel protein [Azospirillum sp. SYSU D00513]